MFLAVFIFRSLHIAGKLRSDTHDFVAFVSQDDGGIEYFNTIVVQPHLKLVTNQGRGFHVRCRYQTRDKVVTNDQTHVSMLQSLPLQVRKCSHLGYTLL